MVVSPPGKK